MSASYSPTSGSQAWILFERVSGDDDYVVRGIFSSEANAHLAAMENGAPSVGPQVPDDEDSWVFGAFRYEVDKVMWDEGYRRD